MKKTNIKQMLSFIVCMLLIAAMALFTIGCNDNAKQADNEESENSGVTQTDVKEIGNGKTKLSFIAVDLYGTETEFQVKTDKTTVGEALAEHNIIAGEEGSYGLYVKTVNCITLDFDKDGTYWAFYVDGKYAEKGVDQTEINENSVYSFKPEK